MPRKFDIKQCKVGDRLVTQGGTVVTALSIVQGHPSNDDPTGRVVVWAGVESSPYLIDDSGSDPDLPYNAVSPCRVTHFAPVVETYWLVPNSVQGFERGQYFTNAEEARRLDPNAICVQREV